MERRYHYRAIVRGVHDGDTVTLDLDLGFGLLLTNQSCRLLGINAPELATPQGAPARNALVALLGGVGGDRDREVFVVTQLDHDEKYGRTLVTLYPTALFRPPSLNALMVKAGHAVPYSGGAR